MTTTSYSARSRYLYPDDHSFRMVVGGAPRPQGGIFISSVRHMVRTLGEFKFYPVFECQAKHIGCWSTLDIGTCGRLLSWMRLLISWLRTPVQRWYPPNNSSLKELLLNLPFPGAVEGICVGPRPGIVGGNFSPMLGTNGAGRGREVCFPQKWRTFYLGIKVVEIIVSQ